MLIDPYRFASQDPDFDSTFMLIHVENGQMYERTGFPAVTPIGGGAVSSVTSRFGTQSFRNPGTSVQGNNYVRVEGSATDFTFPGAFTWEGWFYVVLLNDTYNNFFANNINYPNSGFIQLAIINNGTQHILFNSTAGGQTFQLPFPLNTWEHIAVVRDATNKMGVAIGGQWAAQQPTISGTVGGALAGVSSFDVCRGHANDNADLNCYFEEIRVTKLARYVIGTPFAVPTAPFPPFP